MSNGKQPEEVVDFDFGLQGITIKVGGRVVALDKHKSFHLALLSHFWLMQQLVAAASSPLSKLTLPRP